MSVRDLGDVPAVPPSDYRSAMQKLARAFKRATGTHLSADEIRALYWTDDAIRVVVDQFIDGTTERDE